MTVHRLDAIRPEFLRDQPWKVTARCATTASITIATALNAGDVIDGVTLVAGDRVLVKDQSTGSQNGLYVAGATPVRSEHMCTGLDALGSLTRVLEGTANGAKFFVNTNTGTVTIDTTALTFTSLSSSLTVALDDLTDVTLTTLMAGQLLRYNGSIWVNDVPQPLVEDDGAGSFAFVFEANGEVIWE